MNKEYNAWFSTSHRKYIDLNNFKVEDVNIDDIDVSLNNIKRFTGHAYQNEPLTVAQHTALCLMIAFDMFEQDGGYTDEEKRRLWLGVLLHDFPEAYYGDISSALKRALGNDLKKVTIPIDTAVTNALWPWPDAPLKRWEFDFIHEVDLHSLQAERKHLFNSYRHEDKYWPKFDRRSPNLERYNYYLRYVLQKDDFIPLSEAYTNIIERKGFKI